MEKNASDLPAIGWVFRGPGLFSPESFPTGLSAGSSADGKEHLVCRMCALLIVEFRFSSALYKLFF